jgi:leader peptidase (prepilin peptidase) / N-methyltransferase
VLPAYLAIGVLGLAIGSFLNVVIYRVPRDESIVKPGSHCPSCSAPVRSVHNIPVVGWLMLHGKCATCAERISVRYPLVEALTAVLFVAVTVHFGFSALLPAYLYLTAIAIALAAIDFDVQRLPDAIVLPSYIVGVLLLMPAGAATDDWHAAERGLIGMTALFAVYFALALAYPGGMGFGDVKLAGLLGLFLGWLSWGSILVATFGAFLLGGTVGIGLLAARRATRKSAIPFGPFMLTGAFLALFFAGSASSWYGDLINHSLHSA